MCFVFTPRGSAPLSKNGVRASLATATPKRGTWVAPGYPKAQPQDSFLWFRTATLVCFWRTKPHRHGDHGLERSPAFGRHSLDDETRFGPKTQSRPDFEVLRSMFLPQHSSRFWSDCLLFQLPNTGAGVEPPVIPVVSMLIVCGTAGLINGSARGLYAEHYDRRGAETKAPMPATSYQAAR